MPVPVVDVVAARRDAQRLGQAAGLAAGAAGRVRATQPPSWYGGAASAADLARAELARCVDDVARLGRLAAYAVGVYADRVVPALARMRAAGADLQVALAVQAAEYGSARAAELVSRAWADYESGQVAYRAAVDDCERVLAAVPEQAGPLVRGPGRHLPEGLEAFWRSAVADSVAGAWALTGAYVSDRDTWRSAVGALLPGLVEQVRHPLRTLDELAGGPAWRAGDWGVAAGTAAGSLVGLGKFKRLSRAEKRRYAPSMADPDAPRPRLQPLDELLAEVDLDAHEHADLGHTLRRHVNVDDGYLRDRLVKGTVWDQGVWGPPPAGGRASAWTDRETAQEWIGKTLRANEVKVRTWAGSRQEELVLEAPAPGSIGRVMTRSGEEFELFEPTKIRVALKKEGGSVYVLTAYPDVGEVKAP